MKNIMLCFVIFLSIAVVTGCAYRYYLGMHGPSIQNYADIHTGITEDKECLQCHTPHDKSDIPSTSHPQFKGCLKCHNDALK